MLQTRLLDRAGQSWEKLSIATVIDRISAGLALVLISTPFNAGSWRSGPSRGGEKRLPTTPTNRATAKVDGHHVAITVVICHKSQKNMKKL